MPQLPQPEPTGPAPEPASFEATFRAHCAGLCEFVYAYVRSREIAQELVQDLITIMHCFSSRLYGLRNYRKALSKALKDDQSTQDQAPSDA